MYIGHSIRGQKEVTSPWEHSIDSLPDATTTQLGNLLASTCLIQTHHSEYVEAFDFYLFLLEKDVKIEVWRNRKISLTKVECHLPRIRRMLRASARNFGLSLDKDFFIEYQHLNPNDHCLVRLRPWLDQDGKELTYLPVDEKCEQHQEGY